MCFGVAGYSAVKPKKCLRKRKKNEFLSEDNDRFVKYDIKPLYRLLIERWFRVKARLLSQHSHIQCQKTTAMKVLFNFFFIYIITQITLAF